MDTKQLKEILRLHDLWLKSYPEGQRARLRGANLEGVNLKGANLEGAYLYCAYLDRTDLEGVNLYRANLEGTSLRGANLEGTSLVGARLRGANLEGAYLYRAYLVGADLEGVNLKDTNLVGARMRGANLVGANLEGADLPQFQICPQEGSFVAYKKTTRGVIKLLIPEDAHRTNSLIGRKCRASKVVVLGGEGVGGTGPNYGSLIYEKGKTVECVDYDPDIRVECTRGIHFFMTEKEAQEW